MVSPKNGIMISAGCSKVAPSAPFTVTELSLPSSPCSSVTWPSLKLMSPLLDERQHLLHRGRRGAELGAAMQQRHRLGDRLQVQGPVER